MPIHEYECKQCAKQFEYFHNGSQDKKAECPHCGSREWHKKLPPKNTGFELKGRGWAKDRYGR